MAIMLTTISAFWLVVAISLCAFINFAESSSISHLTLLLPAVKEQPHSVSVTLKATGGCFDWSTPSPNLLLLENQKCKNDISSVSVTPTVLEGGQFTRQSAWVYATEQNDLSASEKELLECEVYIDKISRLEILTRTRVINVGDHESLDVQAFDEEGNCFTTVTGLPFEWKNRNPNILRSVTLPNVKYDSATHPVKGETPGQAEVSVRLEDDSHYVKRATTVKLNVVQPLYLEPSIMYIMPGTDFTYHLQTRGQRTSRERIDVTMPSRTYKWDSSNSTAVAVDSSLGRITGLELGSSNVEVQHTNLEVHSKRASVQVVNPAKIALEVFDVAEEALVCASDQFECCLEKNRDYKIKVYLLDNQNREMKIGSNIQFRHTFDGMNVEKTLTHVDEVSFRTKNHVGQTSVIFQLKPVKSAYHPSAKFDIPVQGRKILNVYKSVKINQNDVILPYTGAEEPKHSFRLSAYGGSQKFKWVVNNKNVVKVQSDGIIIAQKPGEAQITVMDRCNNYNNHTTTIFVSQVSLLRFMSGQVNEVEIGRDHELHIEARPKLDETKEFSNCSALRITSRASGEVTFVKQISTKDSVVQEKGCLAVIVSAQGEGRLEVVLETTQGEGLPRPSDSFTISGFPPLKISDSPIVTAEGFPTDISWSGGPRLVTDDSSALVVPEKDFENHIEVSNAQANSFTLKCLVQHEQTLAVTIRNEQSNNIPNPVTVSGSIELHCFPPLILQAEETQSTHHVSIAVNSKKNVTAGGHPLQQYVHYTILDKQIASISRKTEARVTLEGHNMGHTEIQGIVRHPTWKTDQLFGLNDSLLVNVEIEDFQLVVATKTLVAGYNHMLVHIVGGNGEVPGHPSFKHVTVTWSSDSPVIQLVSPVENTELIDQSRVPGLFGGCQDISARVIARSPGTVPQKATITASIHVGFPVEKEEVRSVLVEVQPRLEILGPASLLIPPNFSSPTKISTSLDRTNIPLKFNVLGDIVSVTGDGQVLARQRGSSVIEVQTLNSADEMGQFVSVPVQVCDIAAIDVSPVIDDSFTESICVGSHVLYKVQLMDHLGRAFTTALGYSIQTSSSNTEILEVSRKSPTKSADVDVVSYIVVRGIGQGDAVVTTVLVSSIPNTKKIQRFVNISVVPENACDEKTVTRIKVALKIAIHSGSSVERLSFSELMKSQVANANELERINVHEVDVERKTFTFDILPPKTQSDTPSSTIKEQFQQKFRTRGGLLHHYVDASVQPTIETVRLELVDDSEVRWVGVRETRTGGTRTGPDCVDPVPDPCAPGAPATPTVEASSTSYLEFFGIHEDNMGPALFSSIVMILLAIAYGFRNYFRNLVTGVKRQQFGGPRSQNYDGGEPGAGGGMGGMG